MGAQAVLTYLPLVTPVATLVVVFVGILFSNRHVDVRISDLRAYIDARFDATNDRIAATNDRISEMDRRLTGLLDAERRVSEANFKVLLGKIEDIDTRLTRLEERFAR